MDPKDFAKHVELTPMSVEPEHYSATGKRLRVHGERLAPFLAQTVDGRSLLTKVPFAVSDVRRPMLA